MKKINEKINIPFLLVVVLIIVNIWWGYKYHTIKKSYFDKLTSSVMWQGKAILYYDDWQSCKEDLAAEKRLSTFLNELVGQARADLLWCDEKGGKR